MTESNLINSYSFFLLQLSIKLRPDLSCSGKSKFLHLLSRINVTRVRKLIKGVTWKTFRLCCVIVISDIPIFQMIAMQRNYSIIFLWCKTITSNTSSSSVTSEFSTCKSDVILTQESDLLQFFCNLSNAQ